MRNLPFDTVHSIVKATNKWLEDHCCETITEDDIHKYIDNGDCLAVRKALMDVYQVPVPLRDEIDGKIDKNEINPIKALCNRFEITYPL
jgi:hypothetical protein